MNRIFKYNKILGHAILLLSIMFSATINAQAKTERERIYIKIEIKGMACPYCAFGMEKELKKVTGVDNIEIELKEGLAFISTPFNQKPTKKILEKIIINGGFTVGEIEFSSKPFKKLKPNNKEY